MGRSKRDNRGSGIVSVIITIAFISALSTALLFMTYMNYQMKISSRAAQRTFYSAEETLDQVRAAMQVIVSDSIRDSYAQTLLDYSNLVSESDFSKAQTAFSQSFISELAKRVGISTMPVVDMPEGVYKFNIDLLIENLCAYTSMSAVTAVEAKAYGLEIAGDSGLGLATLTLVADEKTPRYIELQGFKVTKTVEGYETSIFTDFTIHCPPFVAVAAGYQSRLDSYVIVANGPLKANLAGDATLSGNVFAGALDVSGPGQTLTMNSGRVISPGPYTVKDGATLKIGDSASVWASRITVDSTTRASAIELSGNAQVADDLELVGNQGGSATLKGSYFGFGTGATGLESSAILISGQGSSLNLQSLNSLGLAGRSYIAANPDGTEGIPTAGSLSIKSDQIAYLVPDACISRVTGAVVTSLPNPCIIPTSDNNIPVYTHTPDSGGGAGTFALVAGSGPADPSAVPDYILIALNETLIDFGASAVRRMHVVAGQPTQTLLYFFLSFPTDSDREGYFNQYFSTHSERMGDYLRIYFDQNSPEAINSSGGVSAAGFVYEFAGGSAGYQLRSPVSSGPINAMAATYATQYTNLKGTLFEMEAPANASVTPFSRYIDAEKIDDELAVSAAVPFFIGGETRAVILTAGAGGDSYDLNDKNINLVISMGRTVNINCDFKGLIVSNGEVILSTTTASKDSLLLSEALGAVDGAGNAVLNYLRGTNSAAPKGNGDASTWNLDDLVAFSNWRKNEPTAN